MLQLPAGDFSLTATPSLRSVRHNQSTTYTVTVTPLDGFTGAVTFSVSGLPGGASAAFNPTSVMGSGATTMTVTAGNSRGTFTLAITGASGWLATQRDSDTDGHEVVVHGHSHIRRRRSTKRGSRRRPSHCGFTFRFISFGSGP